MSVRLPSQDVCFSWLSGIHRVAHSCANRTKLVENKGNSFWNKGPEQNKTTQDYVGENYNPGYFESPLSVSNFGKLTG